MIELRHLRYFLAVAEELSFRRASMRVYVDQSPLSRAVRELEEEIGVLLFARTPRTLRLTPAGKVLVDEVRDLLARLERAKERARETDRRYRAPLRVCVADGLHQPMLSECLSSWRSLAPETPLELSELRALDLAHALRREEVDVGFSFGVPEEKSIIQEPAWSYPLMALMPRGHPLAAQESLTLQEVVAFPMITCRSSEQPGKRKQLDELVQRCASTAVYSGEASSLNGLINMVAAGLGVGLIDSGHIATMRRSDIVPIPLDDSAALITTYVVRKRQRAPLSDSLELLLTHAKALKHRLP